MKRLITVLFGLSFTGTVLAAPQVTPRQMTNYVADVRQEISAEMDEKIELNATNLVAATNSIIRQVEQGRAEDFVRMTNEVQQVTQASAEKTAEQVAPLISVDDELHIEDGKAYINIVEARDGNLTNATYYFSISGTTQKGKCFGLRVISSDDVRVPVKTVFAKTGTEFVGNVLSETNFPPTKFTVQRETRTDPAGSYPYWNFAAAYTNVVNGVYYIAKYEGGAIDITADVKKTLIISNVSGQATSISYNYIVSGYRMFDDEWTKITGKAQYDAIEDDWVTLSTEQATRAYINLTQDLETVNIRRFSVLDLFVSRAWASDSIINVIGLPQPKFGGEYVSAWEFAPSDVTEETHRASPSQVANPAQWNEIEYWFDPYPPIPMEVVVTVRLTSGREVTQTMKIRKEEKFLEMLEAGGVVIPPTPWQGPTFTEKNKKCYKGHIYDKCVCTECGEKRAHEPQNGILGGDTCARCGNRNTEWETDRDGIKIPAGEGDYCGEKCDVADVEFHAGWYGVTVSEDNPKIACCCECGFYRVGGNILEHAYEQVDDPVWQDLKDGIHHYYEVSCTRCGTKMQIKEEHELALDEQNPPTTATPKDSDNHEVLGKCEKCTFEGYIEEPHRWKVSPAVEGDEESCYCELCQAYFHKMEEYACGIYGGEYCIRCQKTLGSVDNHDFTNPQMIYSSGKVDEIYHKCSCGRQKAKHYFKNGVCIGTLGGDGKPFGSGCGYVQGKTVDTKCNSRRNGRGGTTTADGHGEDGWKGFGGKPCPFCGGWFLTDYPDANLDGEAVVSVHCSNPLTSWAYGQITLRQGLELWDEWITEIGELLYVGSRTKGEIWFNKRIHTWEHPFIGTVTNVIWQKAYYKGVVEQATDGKTYISW